jgi:hypothetical protein
MAEQGFTRNIIFRLLEDRSFILALIIIGSYIIISAFTIFYLRDVQVFREVSLVYVGWVGAVIGYFFGSRQVDRLIEKIDGLVRIGEERLKELEEERRKVAIERLNVEKSKTEMYEIVRQYEKSLETAKDTIEMLKRKYVE